MFSLIFSAVLLASSLGNSESHASEIDLRIAGGERVTNDERYLVTMFNEPCSFAVLSEWWLLGTRDCFYWQRIEDGETIPVDGIFASVRFYDGLAFLKLFDPLPRFEFGLLSAIALPDLDEVLNLTDTQATIYGAYEMVLRNMTLEIGDACKKFYQSSRARDYFICMEITEERTTCDYDDGALMVVDGKLAAIATTAWVEARCPSSATYQLFIKISAFRELIHTVTGL